MNQNGFFYCSNCGSTCVPLDNVCSACYTISLNWHCNCCNSNIPSQFLQNHFASPLHVSMSNKNRVTKTEPLQVKLPSISMGNDFLEIFPLSSSQAHVKNYSESRKDSKRTKPVYMEEEMNLGQPKLNDSCLLLPQNRETFLRKSKDTIATLSKLSCELLEQCEKEEFAPVKPSKRLFSSVDREEALPFLQLPPLTPAIASSHTPNSPPLSPFAISSPPQKKQHLSSDYESSSPLRRSQESSPLSSPYVFSPINPPSSSPTSTLDFPTFTPTPSRPSTHSNPCWWKTNSNQSITDQGGHYFCVCNPSEKLSKTYNKGKCSKCQHHLKWWCNVCQKAMWWNGRTAHRASNAHVAGCKLLKK